MEKKVKRILFIHGLASSGEFKTAGSLRLLLKDCEVLSPDIPIDPKEAMCLLSEICHESRPNLIIGLSLGGFWAQKLRGFKKILINPDLHVSRLLRKHMGEMEYLCPRKDGARSFTITEDICKAYEAMEASEFDGLDENETAITFGMFADKDELVNCKKEFETYYPDHCIVYPGKHLPNHNEIRDCIIPVAKELLY